MSASESRCHMSPEEFAHYKLLPGILGEGQFGAVRRAINTVTQEMVAIKTIPKGATTQRECHILSILDHPHVIHLHGGYDDGTKFHWILSVMEGGDLVNEINATKRSYTSIEVRHLFLQIVDAVAYCHSQDIVHRDIKLDNILIRKPTLGMIMSADLVLSDFGFATTQAVGARLMDHPGTLAYSSPEVVGGKSYDGRASDIWAMGVCLYSLIMHELPFYDPDEDEMAYRIWYSTPYLPPDMPESMKALILGMLIKKPRLRLTMDQIRTNPWYLGLV